MLVLHVVAPGEVGGLERVVQSLAQGQAHAGDDVHVAAVLDRGHEDHWLLGTLAAVGVGTHSLVVPNRAYWRERAAIVELCRRLRPASCIRTAIGRTSSTPVPRGGWASPRSPQFTASHGAAGTPAVRAAAATCYRRFEAVVAVSRPLVELLTRDGIPPHKVHFVQNAWLKQRRRSIARRRDAPWV